jgi:hypothetical protein
VRVPIHAVAAVAILVTASCHADEGNLFVRCPGTDGATAVSNGQVTIDRVTLRVSADLTAPSSAQDGMTFAIEVRLPDSPSHSAPSVDCVRVEKPVDSARWDARPYTVHEFFDGSTARVVADGDHGPHWVAGDAVDVTVWLTVASRRYPLMLGRQPIHP